MQAQKIMFMFIFCEKTDLKGYLIYSYFLTWLYLNPPLYIKYIYILF